MSLPSGQNEIEPPAQTGQDTVHGQGAVQGKGELVLRDVRPRRRGRKRRLLAGVTGIFLLLACALAGVLVYVDARLDRGPLAVASLGPAIAQSLSTRAGAGYQVTIGNTFLAKEEGRPTITIDSFRLVGANGETILSVPKAIVGIDWAALLSGSIKLRRLAVAGLDLHVQVDANGALSVSAGKTRINLTGSSKAVAPVAAQAGQPGPSAPERKAGFAVAALAAGLAQSLDQLFAQAGQQGSSLSALRHIGITGGRLVFGDVSRNRSTAFDGLNMEVVRHGKAVEVSLSATGPAGRWHLKAGVRAEKSHQLDIEIGNVTLDEVMLIGGLRELPVDFDMPLNGKASLHLGLAGDINEAKGTFSTGKGYFLVRNRDFEPLLVDRLAGSFRWDPASKAILIDRVGYRAGETDLDLHGQIVPPAAGAAVWRVGLSTSRAGKVAHQKYSKQSVAIGRLQADVLVDSARKVLTVERFALAAPDAHFLLSGMFDYNSGNRRLQLTGQADPMAVDRALSIWPSYVAAPVRGWALQNVAGGKLESLRVKLDFGEEALIALAEKRFLPPGSMDISYKVSGATFAYLKGVNPVAGVSAEGRTLGQVTDIDIKAGVSVLAGGKRLALLPSTVKIPDRAPNPATVSAHVKLSGALKDAAAHLAQPGLAKYAPAGIDLSKTTGKIETSIDLDFLIGKKVADPMVEAVTRARLTGLTFADFVGPAALENGNIDLTIRNGQLSAKGTGRLLGSPATIAVSKQGQGPMQGTIGLSLDAAARKKLGWNTGGKIDGPVGVKIAGQLARGQGLRGDVTLDLSKASLVDLVPGFDKPAGRAASASFKIAARENATTLSHFVFRSQGLSARGTIELGAKGVFNSATLSQLKMSPGDDLRAEIKGTGSAMRIALSGGAVDLRPFLSRNGPAPGSVDSSFQLAVNTRIATGFNGRVLGAFKMDMAADKSGISKFQLDARSGRASVRGRLLQRGAGGAQIEVVSADAGNLLSFMDIYKRMEGGRMTLRARAAGASVSGSLDVRDFVLRNEPALRQLVARGTNDQVRSQIDATSVRFQKLQFAFQRGDGQLAVRDGILNGPEIGLTLDGTLDFSGDRVAMNGTFVPAYGLNNAFARIPLFGPILGGGKNEGLLGVNFRVSGRASAPVLNINPLSAIAPGFLRKIFGALPAQPQAPGSPAPTERLQNMPMNLGRNR